MIDKLKKIIIENCPNYSGVEISEKTNLVNDLGFDSLSLITLLVNIEEEFNVQFDDFALEFENIIYVLNILNFIIAKKGKDND